ncbi:MAG: tripartite tricarboxylate transporter substrate binding protein [Betaproteobacteria bacterium]|nr:tripartite tricarboxylate transporter substrate binding protein [Betaproteobacteria bacterium]MBI3052870.1 tripartite tricarboxylate transporter substrate binding protein [Betaproteobacteria bacterium]
MPPSRILPVVLTALCAGAACAQNYPSKPVRIVTSVTGGSLDLTARLIAPKLAERLGQQVIVDNRGGVLSMEMVAKAPADGYTLLLASGSLWISQFLRDNVAWDAMRDYAPIALLATSPNIIVVHPSLPARSIRELIALAKARPSELNYSSGQAGASAHLAGELFKAMAGVNIQRIAYKGQGPAMLALITGEAQLSFPNAASATPFIKAGRIIGLAVTTLQPSALAPGLPTAAASGLPGYESRAMLGMFAPARTSSAVVDQLHQEIASVLKSADVKQRLFDSGSEAIAGSPAEMTAAMKSEMATTGKLIKDAGIRAE